MLWTFRSNPAKPSSPRTTCVDVAEAKETPDNAPSHAERTVNLHGTYPTWGDIGQSRILSRVAERIFYGG